MRSSQRQRQRQRVWRSSVFMLVLASLVASAAAVDCSNALAKKAYSIEAVPYDPVSTKNILPNGYKDIFEDT